MNKKILLIEDDPEVLINLETLLSEEGYDVITAENGFEGVKSAKENIPDIIICDVLMPKMTGYEVLKTLSLIDSTETIPFLFLTAKTEVKDIREGLKLGADDYLLKPYDSDELLEAIELRLKKLDKLKSVQSGHNETSKEEKERYSEDDRLFLNIKNKPQFVKINSIVYIQSDRQYITLYFSDGSNLLMRKSLSYWETILPEKIFKRVHRSSIVNVNYIKKIEKWFNNSYKIFLTDNFGEIDMSKRYASKVKKQF